MRGAPSTVWFDRRRISPDSPEHLESIDSMCSTLGSIITDEVQAGIPKNRILIGMNFVVNICFTVCAVFDFLSNANPSVHTIHKSIF